LGFMPEYALTCECIVQSNTTMEKCCSRGKTEFTAADVMIHPKSHLDNTWGVLSHKNRDPVVTFERKWRGCELWYRWFL